jgi:hypothetical protein
VRTEDRKNTARKKYNNGTKKKEGRRWLSNEMLQNVPWKTLIDVSEQLTAFSSTLVTEAVSFSETSVIIHQKTRYNISDDSRFGLVFVRIENLTK